MKTIITKLFNGADFYKVKVLAILLFFFAIGIQSLKADEPVIKQYTAAQAADLMADITAKAADIYELTESGGDYKVVVDAQNHFSQIGSSFVLRAARGLTEKPVIRMEYGGTFSGIRFFYVWNVADLTIQFEGIEFDGVNSHLSATYQPMLFYAASGTNNCKLIIKNCYIHGFKNAANNGVIRFYAAGSSLDMQNSRLDNCTKRVINFSTASTAYGDLIFKNNVFSNLGVAGDNQGHLVYYYPSTATGKSAYIDQCTFYNFVNSSSFNQFLFRSMTDPTPNIVFKNSVFVDIVGTLGNSPERTLDSCYVEGFSTVPSGTGVTNSFAVTPAPAFADVNNLDFTLTNGESFLLASGKVAGYNTVRLLTPSVGTASAINTFGFTANWTAVDNAQGYKVEVYQGDDLIDTYDASGESTNYLQITGLDNQTEYTYKVKAVGDIYFADSFVSTASDPVTTGPTTGSNNISLDVLIYSLDKSVMLSSFGDITIYSLQGKELCKAKNADRITTTLESGLYIVKFVSDNGAIKQQKVFIR